MLQYAGLAFYSHHFKLKQTHENRTACRFTGRQENEGTRHMTDGYDVGRLELN
jgi:hypothetical protein